jgi:hypothetical protein
LPAEISSQHEDVTAQAEQVQGRRQSLQTVEARMLRRFPAALRMVLPVLPLWCNLLHPGKHCIPAE